MVAVTGGWSAAARLNARRYASTSTLLADGRVLVAGGRISKGCLVSPGLQSAELYDPATDSWRCPAGETLSLYKTSRTLQKKDYTTRACGTWPVAFITMRLSEGTARLSRRVAISRVRRL